MKRIAALLAGIVMVSGLSFAEVKWDFKGTKVDFEQTFLDSETETMETGDEIDLILKLKTDLDESTKISLKYDTDDSNPDNKAEMIVTRKISDYITAQVDLDVVTTTGFAIEEDKDSDKSFIEFKATDAVTLKFMPLTMKMNVGDEFETDNALEKGGVEAKIKMSEDLKVIAGLGTSPFTNEKNEETTSFNLKGGAEFNLEGLSIKAIFTTNTQASAKDYKLETAVDDPLTETINEKEEAEKKSIKEINAKVATLQTALSVMATYEMGDLELTGEMLMSKMNTYASDETGTAIFAEAAYSLGELMEGIKVVPYGSFKSISKYAYFDDSDSATFDSKNDNHGGLTIIEAGAKLKNKGLTVKPYFELSTAKNKIYGTDKSKTVIGTVVEVKF